jgi:hypothetical protein
MDISGPTVPVAAPWYLDFNGRQYSGWMLFHLLSLVTLGRHGSVVPCLGLACVCMPISMPPPKVKFLVLRFTSTFPNGRSAVGILADEFQNFNLGYGEMR